jgi:hypothetical protein
MKIKDSTPLFALWVKLLFASGNGILKSKYIVGSRRVMEFQKAVPIEPLM